MTHPSPTAETPDHRSWRGKIVNGILRPFGWKMRTEPVPKKCILIGYPHTSNWDGVLMLMCAFQIGYRVHFLGKKELFRGPLGPLMRALGGIAVDRKHAGGVVGSMTEAFAKADQLRLVISPEGTRSLVPTWKSGFYRIALEAGVPLGLGYIDARTKVAGIGPTITLSGNADEDMATIREFYRDVVGIKPEKTAIPRLRTETSSPDDDAASGNAESAAH